VNEELSDITDFSTWKIVEHINDGWSNDKKYYIEDYSGNRLLLRTSDISMLEAKKKEFEFLKRCNSLKFKMSKAVSFGICNHNRNVYMILSWVEGISLRKILNQLTEKEQYKLGIQAGRILKEIHSIAVDCCDISEKDRKEKKLQKLKSYEDSCFRVYDDQFAIDFVRNNIGKINPLPPVYEHGDFHVGNLVLTPDNQLGVIDFNRWDCGDRYEDFYKVQFFNVEISVPFSVGQIDGYFDCQPPTEFWEVVAVYVAFAALYSIIWAEEFGEDEINGMKMRCLKSFADYDHFKTVIPHRYQDNFMKYRKWA
jgi:aminoglycoside phosphotransferase (APT) family kinase protein